MTTYQQTTTTASSELGKIFKFKHNNNLTTSGFSDIYDIDSLLSNPLFENLIHSKINAIIHSRLFEFVEDSLINYTSPFDSIYLSKLMPDKIDKLDFLLIQKLSSIEDLSDELIFDEDID